MDAHFKRPNKEDKAGRAAYDCAKKMYNLGYILDYSVIKKVTREKVRRITRELKAIGFRLTESSVPCFTNDFFRARINSDYLELCIETNFDRWANSKDFKIDIRFDHSIDNLPILIYQATKIAKSGLLNFRGSIDPIILS
jgi:predicted kinase